MSGDPKASAPRARILRKTGCAFVEPVAGQTVVVTDSDVLATGLGLTDMGYTMAALAVLMRRGHDALVAGKLDEERAWTEQQDRLAAQIKAHAEAAWAAWWQQAEIDAASMQGALTGYSEVRVTHGSPIGSIPGAMKIEPDRVTWNEPSETPGEWQSRVRQAAINEGWRHALQQEQAAGGQHIAGSMEFNSGDADGYGAAMFHMARQAHPHFPAKGGHRPALHRPSGEWTALTATGNFWWYAEGNRWVWEGYSVNEPGFTNRVFQRAPDTEWIMVRSHENLLAAITAEDARHEPAMTEVRPGTASSDVDAREATAAAATSLGIGSVGGPWDDSWQSHTPPNPGERVVSGVITRPMEPNRLEPLVKLRPHDIGWAVQQMHDGRRVCRRGWNGKDMFLFLVPGSHFKVNRPPLLGIYPEGTGIDYCAHIDMRTADGKIIPWLCSQADLLATDWEIAP